MKKRDTFFPDLFIPPDGLIRIPPPDKLEAYAKKSNSIGSFSRHVYDLDICTLYRQMDDLNGRYEEFGDRPYGNYVQQIRENVKYDLSRYKLDPEFYIDHFYWVIKPSDSAYVTYMGLFLSMSHLLLIIPKLEHHLKQFLIHDTLGRGAESFLGELEFHICSGIRTARFPEDYNVKHEKIINWIYNKREAEQYRKEMNSKLDALILGINRISPEQKISKEIIKQTGGKKKDLSTDVFVDQNMIKVFIKDLNGYFNKNSHDALRKILSGKAESSLIVNFDGQANQLIDVFRRYTKAKFIQADLRAVASWICRHFMYKNETLKGFVPFDNGATERVIYSTKLLPKNKRIPISTITP